MSDTTVQFQEGLQRICDLAEDLAKQEGILLTSIRLDGGRPPLISTYHMLELAVGDHLVTEKLHHEEIEEYTGRAGAGLTRNKISSAIERLKMQVEG